MHFETDEQGRVVLSSVPSGSYVIEARSDSLNLKGFEKIAYVEADTTTPLTVEVSEPTKVSGRVGLPQLVRRSATVSVQGLDYQVPMDSTGYFEFESLPNGNVEIVAFVNDADADSVTEYGRIEADVGAPSGEGALYLKMKLYLMTLKMAQTRGNLRHHSTRRSPLILNRQVLVAKARRRTLSVNAILRLSGTGRLSVVNWVAMST